ncbi:MAG: hypothetical protein RIG68_05955 [Imperialibacter sp.]|uniref:hypothetical protein n=1 Tax=Imperialibacter sp. TaxID=2038411 RepID=UPI0032EAA65B
MKYPVAFRVFGVINLLLFLFLALMVFATLAGSYSYTLLLAHAQLFVTVWVLVATLAWMFAAKSSYHFLYSMGFALIILCVLWLLASFDLPFPNRQSGSDKRVMAIIFGSLLIYPIFLFGALFYQPLQQWTSSRFSLKHLGYFTLVLFITSLLLTGFVWVNIRSIRIPVGIASATQNDEISHSQYRQVTFEYPILTNGFKNESLHPDKNNFPAFVELAYVAQRPFDYSSAQKLIVEVEQGFSDIKIRFPLTKMAAYELRPCTKEGKLIEGNQSYYIGKLTPSLFYRMFDDPTTTIFFDEGFEEELATYEEEDEYDPYAGYNGAKLSSETNPRLRGLFLINLYQKNPDYRDYYYDMSNPIELEYDGQALNYGMLKLGMPYVVPAFMGAVRTFQGFQHYEMDSYLETLTGQPLYLQNDSEELERFNLVNPEILSYAEETLIPVPDEYAGGKTMQEVYDMMFQRLARMAVLSHNHLHDSLDIKAEARAYIDLVTYSREFYAPTYLMQKYSSPQERALDGRNDTWTQDWEFIGFWLRRNIDGTDNLIWGIITRVMNQYDKEWFDSNVASNEEGAPPPL